MWKGSNPPWSCYAQEWEFVLKFLAGVMVINKQVGEKEGVSNPKQQKQPWRRKEINFRGNIMPFWAWILQQPIKLI